MGKTQKRRAESSGGDDSEAEVQPAKKVKQTSKASAPKKGSSALEKGKDAEGNPFWPLSAMRRVGISKFKGKVLINIREYYENNGELKPGKKGISLGVDQYQALLKAIPAINAELRKEGAAIEDAGDDEAAVDEADAAPARPKKAPKKANIEATSDEDSD